MVKELRTVIPKSFLSCLLRCQASRIIKNNLKLQLGKKKQSKTYVSRGIREMSASQFVVGPLAKDLDFILVLK